MDKSKDVEVYVIGKDKKDARENSKIFFSRREARLHAVGADYDEENLNVYGTIATIILHDLEQV